LGNGSQQRALSAPTRMEAGVSQTPTFNPA
jgi:hypothetical protein